jgi:hypothetical protein
MPEHFVGGLADVLAEVIVPGVGKEYHFAGVACVTGLLFQPVYNCLLDELRDLPRLRDEQDGLRDGTQRRVVHGIDKPWYEGGQARPFVHHAKGAVVERSRVSRVVVVQELGLVGGHIDVDRAFAVADFAGQAEIKRFFNLIVFPAAFDDLALGHLPEQVDAGADGVLFLE